MQSKTPNRRSHDPNGSVRNVRHCRNEPQPSCRHLAFEFLKRAAYRRATLAGMNRQPVVLVLRRRPDARLRPWIRVGGLWFLAEAGRRKDEEASRKPGCR